MLRRFIGEEDGIAMGLAVIVVVIVGVMGAGLLVFVRNDLEAVVQVNQGQEAFETAEAGVQAAKRELLSDACPQSYDGQEAGTEDPDDSCADSEESDWSYAAVADENDAVGPQLDFDGKQIDVSVRHLPFPGEGDCASSDTSEENCAPDNPEGVDDEREFFKVESLGESGNGDARRKVEAIYHTEDLGVPRAYFSPSDIKIRGTASIEGVSLFSLGDIEVDGDQVSGEDQAYGNWAEDPDTGAPNEYNDEPRSTTEAGVGAVGDITGAGAPVDGRDYDSDTCPEFVEDADDSSPCSDPNITFPFDPDTQVGDQDENRINFLREEAQRQEDNSETGEDHYIEYGGTGNQSLSDWPADSTENTVVFADFPDDDSGGSRKLKWNVDGSCSDEPVKGTLVVQNGNFDLGQNTTPLQGTVIVRGGEYQEGNSDDTGGNTCIDGFVNASGEITIRGSVEPFVSGDDVARPGFYGVETWSWRELYE